ncbi:MAG: MBOAT family protein [Defluviitaleaceae bacterium]|nr:MBOAT family protein [Defluviitaleaceae bacterium]
MVFSSLTFIVLFLPIFLFAYFCVPQRYVKMRNFVLLVFSLLFYAAGEPVWVLLLIFSAASDCLIGLFMERFQGRWQSKVLLVLSMCCNLGVLVVFKYTEFLLGLVGINIDFAPVLPIGISFYTFQTMSYSIDLYRGRIKAQRNPIAFLTYVAMFPPLIAGPIIRYADIQHMLAARATSISKVSEGVSRFAMGLGKKVIFANHAGAVSSELLAYGGSSTLAVWVGIIMFMFQIYFDFSGYSDMAIGLGKIIGFDFLENFNYPYTAKTITDFWRRWHISLGTFFREYLYLPIGGNRKRAVFNIMFVWMITGLWHGASLNFVAWGMYFGVILLIEKYLLRKVLAKTPAFFSHVYCLGVVLFGWLLFYFTDAGQFAHAVRNFLGLGGLLYDYRAVDLLLANLWILPIFAMFSTRAPIRILENVKVYLPVAEPLLNFAVLGVGVMLMIGQTFSPFIYFRF